jgi:hypothetical protein
VQRQTAVELETRYKRPADPKDATRTTTSTKTGADKGRPEPKPERPTKPAQPTTDGRWREHGDAGGASAPRGAEQAPTPPPPSVAAGPAEPPADEADADDYAPMSRRIALTDGALAGEVLAMSMPGSRRWRISAGVGGGLLRSGGATSSLLSLNARLERAVAPTSLIGLDASLWLVEGEDVVGRVLGSFARVGIARWLEVGIGVGLQLGNGLGPAGAASLRFHLPPVPRASLFLRYDGAILYDAAVRTGQSSGTFGLELGF